MYHKGSRKGWKNKCLKILTIGRRKKKDEKNLLIYLRTKCLEDSHGTNTTARKHGPACLKIENADRHSATAFMVSVNVF